MLRILSLSVLMAVALIDTAAAQSWRDLFEGRGPLIVPQDGGSGAPLIAPPVVVNPLPGYRPDLPGLTGSRYGTLPDQCLQGIETRSGWRAIYNAACLQGDLRLARALPNTCRSYVMGRGGIADGYDPDCLQEYGFRIGY